MPQITKDFIKKIGEIFKKSEKLYETEEKIKSQTQNLATRLAELFIEQIDNEILRDKKKRKYAIQPCCRRKGYVLFKGKPVYYGRQNKPTGCNELCERK